MCLRCRGVFENNQFEIEKNTLESDAKRFDDVLFGVTWTLSRAPEIGTKITTGKYPLCSIKTKSFSSDIKPYTIYYTYNKGCVWLISMILSI